MTDLREAEQMAYAVPLHELLAAVPRDARLVIEDADGKGTRFIPVGRYCHEAAEALRAALAQPPCATGSQCVGNKCERCAVQEREWVGLTDEEMRQAAQAMDAEPLAEGWKELVKFARAIEAKLREKNFDRPS